ncbi:hypothetical protein [Candidatus Neptunichlamydia sp. REUL1]|uniref:hypothetical protein n=1 Tax=Candidatus Neptunichlamydia sp. REUL1 TaxID=3064277 RepID=UPI002931140E|nr:hypothetical protein [Candidatus Neptunochlamydia sp. REUL1]
MSSSVRLQSSFNVEVQLNGNIETIPFSNLPTNIRVSALREKIFEDRELVDGDSYKLLFSKTETPLTDINIQQIFQGEGGYAILKKEACEASVLMNSDKSSSTSSNSYKSQESIRSLVSSEMPKGDPCVEESEAKTHEIIQNHPNPLRRKTEYFDIPFSITFRPTATPMEGMHAATPIEEPQAPISRPIVSTMPMSNREKRKVGVIFALALLVLAYSAHKYFYGNTKPQTQPQELPKSTLQKI